jgi:hypothetical protein
MNSVFFETDYKSAKTVHFFQIPNSYFWGINGKSLVINGLFWGFNGKESTKAPKCKTPDAVVKSQLNFCIRRAKFFFFCF